MISNVMIQNKLARIVLIYVLSKFCHDGILQGYLSDQFIYYFLLNLKEFTILLFEISRLDKIERLGQLCT